MSSQVRITLARPSSERVGRFTHHQRVRGSEACGGLSMSSTVPSSRTRSAMAWCVPSRRSAL